MGQKFDCKKSNESEKDFDKRAAGFRCTDEVHTKDAFFKIMKKYDERKSVLSCGGAKDVDGLHPGHAYALLELVEQGDFRMIQIRNPWGTGEWKGAWSDKSQEWIDHPEVAKACHVDINADVDDEDDGAFWMCYEDFLKCWGRVGIVDRSIDIHSLILNIKDEGKWYGPTTACLRGCGEYWCCCLGARRLYCAHRSSDDTMKTGCCGLC